MINYDLIQTGCAVISLIVSFVALQRVNSLKKNINNSGKTGDTKMSIKGNKNRQINHGKTDIQQ